MRACGLSGPGAAIRAAVVDRWGQARDKVRATAGDARVQDPVGDGARLPAEIVARASGRVADGGTVADKAADTAGGRGSSIKMRTVSAIISRERFREIDKPGKDR